MIKLSCILLLAMILGICLKPAAAMPVQLPDIPECGTSHRTDVLGYIVCAANATYARQNDLDRRLRAVETLSGGFRDQVWSLAGDREEVAELSRLSFVDPRRQLQTKYQIELALCRWGVATSPRLGCPPVKP